MEQRPPQFLTPSREQGVFWDWWRENPAEIILVVFIIAVFFLVPWDGAGLTEQPIDTSDITVVP